MVLRFNTLKGDLYYHPQTAEHAEELIRSVQKAQGIQSETLVSVSFPLEDQVVFISHQGAYHCTFGAQTVHLPERIESAGNPALEMTMLYQHSSRREMVLHVFSDQQEVVYHGILRVIPGTYGRLEVDLLNAVVSGPPGSISKLIAEIEPRAQRRIMQLLSEERAPLALCG